MKKRQSAWRRIINGRRVSDRPQRIPADAATAALEVHLLGVWTELDVGREAMLELRKSGESVAAHEPFSGASSEGRGREDKWDDQGIAIAVKAGR